MKNKLAVFCILLSALLLFTACSSKFSNNQNLTPLSQGSNEAAAENQEADINASEEISEPKTTPEVTVEEITNAAIKPEPNIESSVMGVNHWAIEELASLKQLVLPYFDSNSPLFMGKDNVVIFSEYLFQSKLLDEPIPLNHWETLIRALFLFKYEEKDNQMIAMYITNLNENDKLDRQSSISGLMKLLSLRYPLPLGGSFEDLKASEAISDMGKCHEMHEFLVRQAYCEGFTDKSVEMNLFFRPEDPMTYGEAISTVFRVLSRYGFPENEIEQSLEPAPSMTKDMAWMRLECEDYYKKLTSSETDENKKKIMMLQSAESIIGPGSDETTWNSPLELAVWQKVLNEALGISLDEVLSYTSFNQGDYITYDVAAVSIFKLGFLINAFDCRDATNDEIEAARQSIKDFDKAMDISKLAQMVSSGLLKGISEAEGFSAEGLVTKGQAMLLVKRIVENIH